MITHYILYLPEPLESLRILNARSLIVMHISKATQNFTNIAGMQSYLLTTRLNCYSQVCQLITVKVDKNTKLQVLHLSNQHAD